MNIIKKIQIGSKVFFSKFKDYNSKDNDWFILVEDFIKGKNSMRCNIKDDDLIMYRKDITKKEMLEECKLVSLKIGKFLVPEFIKYYKVTIKDLKTLVDLCEKLDDAHKYEKIIIESYIQNNKFELSEEQLSLAYEEYKKYRINGLTIIKTFEVGSRPFFKDFKDYKIRDYDYIVLVKGLEKKFKKRFGIENKDYIAYNNNVTKEQLINFVKESKIVNKLCMFLVPEFIDYFKVTIEDLRQFVEISENLDKLHKYLKIILDAYIENNSFSLTNEQLNDAYIEYKKERELLNNDTILK